MASSTIGPHGRQTMSQMSGLHVHKQKGEISSRKYSEECAHEKAEMKEEKKKLQQKEVDIDALIKEDERIQQALLGCRLGLQDFFVEALFQEPKYNIGASRLRVLVVLAGSEV